MFYLSKSKYCQFWQCPKLAWLNSYRQEEKTVDKSDEVRFMAGNEVGNLAKSLFGDFVDVTSYEDDRLNLSKMIEKTREEISKGTTVICEGSFSYKGLYCAVDILRKEDDGWSIYEVKSSTNSASKNEVKAVYVADISYQKYVLEHCGIKIYGTYLVGINSDYIRGDASLNSQMFMI